MVIGSNAVQAAITQVDARSARKFTGSGMNLTNLVATQQRRGFAQSLFELISGFLF